MRFYKRGQDLFKAISGDNGLQPGFLDPSQLPDLANMRFGPLKRAESPGPNGIKSAIIVITADLAGPGGADGRADFLQLFDRDEDDQFVVLCHVISAILTDVEIIVKKEKNSFNFAWYLL